MPANDFYLEVFFSGLVFYVTDERESDGSISKVTHVVLRDGRKGMHDFTLGYAARGPHADRSQIYADDLLHEAKVSVIRNGNIVDTPLEKEWLYFEWEGNQGPLPDTEPVGGPEDVREHLPDGDTASSFYWVPFVRDLGPKNAVVEECYNDSPEKPAVVACVPLEYGRLTTSVFAWVHQFKPKPNTTNQVEKERWIPRLKFSPEQGMPTRVDRAAAEGVTWTVKKPPSGATKLHIYKVRFDDPDHNKIPVESYDFKKVKRALVGVTNYPKEWKMPDNVIHPGRGHDYGSLHFEMFYDLLRAPVPPGIRHIPWTPGACKESPEFLRNAKPYYKIGPCPVDLGKQKKPSDYETAAEAFAKDDRPICVGGGGS